MLDMRHKNIGATVSMLKMIHKVAGDNEELPTALTELFMLESGECDSKVEGACTFEVYPEACISPPKCMVGNCPLGEIVDEELDGMSFTEIEKKMEDNK